MLLFYIKIRYPFATHSYRDATQLENIWKKNFPIYLCES